MRFGSLVAALTTTVVAAGLVTATPAVAAVATITSFAPTSGTLSDPVTIHGTDFVGVSTVRIGGRVANFSVVDATRIDATVPLDAGTGKITVSTPDGLATSGSAFRVTPGADVRPRTTAAGSPITVYAVGLTPGAGAVITLDGVNAGSATVSVNGSLAAPVTIPAGAASGPHPIVVTPSSGDPVQTSVRVSTDWPTPGGDIGRSSWNADEHLLGNANADKLTIAWSDPLVPPRATGPQGVAPPSIVDGVMYTVGASGGVKPAAAYALDEVTGEKIWERDFSKGALRIQPTVAYGFVYMFRRVARTMYLYALDAKTGTIMWRDDFTTPVGVPGLAAYRNRLYFVVAGGADGYPNTLYELDAITGSTILRQPIASAVRSAVTVDNAIVYLTSADGSLQALKASTILPIWKNTSLGDGGAVVAEGGTVYAAGAGAVMALDGSSGAVKWSMPGVGTNAHLALADGVLYVTQTTPRNTLTAYDASDGTVLTSRRLKGTSYGAPAVANGMVYVSIAVHGASPASWLYAYRANGLFQRAAYQFGDNIDKGYHAPVVANGAVTVGGTFGQPLVHYTLPG